MIPIYLEHPQNGITYVYSKDDVKRLEGLGWVRVQAKEERKPEVRQVLHLKRKGK